MIMAREGTPAVWTVAELLRWTEAYFRRLGLPTPLLDAEILLAHALGSTRLALYTEYQKLVEPEERARFRALVERRAGREPVAYITGRREFYSLSFEVTPAVLIPRPETEHLVEAALAELKRLEAGRGAEDAAPRVLDLGTGSGNIAIAIAVHAPRARVDAVDLSEPALDVARRNAGAHGVSDRVSFFLGDLLDGAPAGALYDIVASNPPYIALEEQPGLMDDVRLHEPRHALIDSKGAGGDGLGHYRTLGRGLGGRLRPGGWVGVEVGASQAASVIAILAGAGLQHERTVRDYAGVERVITFRAGNAGLPENRSVEAE